MTLQDGESIVQENQGRAEEGAVCYACATNNQSAFASRRLKETGEVAMIRFWRRRLIEKVMYLLTTNNMGEYGRMKIFTLTPALPPALSHLLPQSQWLRPKPVDKEIDAYQVQLPGAQRKMEKVSTEM